ncbi:hypothetical protein HOLleu_27141 [Holothuria leucospilota]|uniref:Ig-like domain-containing protein n=1 Tax=Holothuria leucospilota TaxID=206669 RepID=A0A9Q1BQ08_HOLLE|nr:hypothetical protein HOLleu_27141 [Holothuria leucospilota]
MSFILLVLLHSLILKGWTAELQDITVVERQTVKLGCNNCTSNYGKWLHNKRPLYTNNLAGVDGRNNIKLKPYYVLEISNATISDEGLYRCKCNNSDVSVFNFTISVLPTLVLRLVSPSVPIGNQSRIYLLSKKENNLTLSCTAIKARPTSRIAWEVNGQKVNSPPEEVTQNPQKNYTSDSKSVLGFQPQSKTIDVTCRASGAQERNRSLQLVLIYDKETEHDGLEGIIILGLITLTAVIFGVSFLKYKKKRYGKTQEIPQSPIDEVQTGHSLQASQHQTQIGNHGQHIFTMTTKMGLREIKLETKLPGKGMIRYWRAVDMTNSGKSGKCVARSITEQAQMVDLYSFKELAKCLVLLERNENVVNTIGVKVDDGMETFFHLNCFTYLPFIMKY